MANCPIANSLVVNLIRQSRMNSFQSLIFRRTHVVKLFLVSIFIMIYLISAHRKPSYVYDSGIHENVPEYIRPFVQRSTKNVTIDEILKKTKVEVNVDRSLFNNSIVLLTEWYPESDPRRKLELIYVLRLNLMNEAIEKIHFIQSTAPCSIWEDISIDPSFPIDLLKSKLIISYEQRSEATRRLTIGEVFKYGNRLNSIGYKIFTNLDIFFDNSLLLLKHRSMFDRRTIFYLSRYEIDPSISSMGLQCVNENYQGSHDALIFQTLLPNELVEKFLNEEIGTWNLETAIIKQLIQLNYQVRNPCKTLRVWHYHSSQVRHRLMPVKINSQIVLSPPEFLSQ